MEKKWSLPPLATGKYQSMKGRTHRHVVIGDDTPLGDVYNSSKALTGSLLP
jgi:hypothetical protein